MTVPLLDELAAMRARLARLEPAMFAPDACARVVDELAALHKACDAATARFAARASAGGAHRAKGFVDPGEWLGATTGTSSATARRRLQTVGDLEACPATEQAVASGAVSMEQAAEIAAAERDAPGSEAELLDVAARRPLRVLKKQARKRRLEALDRRTLAARQRQARRLRTWTDELGLVCGAFALEPEAGARLLARLDVDTERLRRQARRRGCEEEWEAHAADALSALADTTASAGDDIVGQRSRATGTEVVFVCDLRAWRRGHPHPGEPCHVVGGGPVTVEAVREHLDTGDAFVKAVVHDGVAVQFVKHYGRRIKAEVRTALDLGAPPGFDGRECGCGCGQTYKLQNDHVDPLANGGATELDNLQPRTAREHQAKTDEDRARGRLGPRAKKRRAGRDRSAGLCEQPLIE